MSSIIAGNIPFTRWGYEKVFSNSFLYPSDYVAHPIQGSRDALFKMVNDVRLLNRNPTDRVQQSVFLKPVRVVARAVAGIGITIFLAPMGVFYHGTGLLGDTLVVVKLRINDDPNCSRQILKISKRFEALRVDLKAVLAGVVVGFVNLGALYSGIGWVAAVQVINLSLASVDVAVALATVKKQATPWLKSIFLRKEFGLVDNNGSLLKASESKDVEDRAYGLRHFENLWDASWIEILKLIQKIQNDLQVNDVLPMGTTGLPDLQKIKQHINDLKERHLLGENPQKILEKLQQLERWYEITGKLENFIVRAVRREKKLPLHIPVKLQFSKLESIPNYFEKQNGPKSSDSQAYSNGLGSADQPD